MSLGADRGARWAWQHPNLTRHISGDQRVTFSGKPKSGKKRPPRPHMGLTEYLANMQLLLCSDAFGTWPLNVRFFAKDVYDNWTRKVPGFQQPPLRRLRMPRSGISFLLDPSVATTHAQAPAKMKEKPMDERISDFQAWDSTKALYGLDVGYEPYKAAVSKSNTALTQSSTNAKCAVCDGALDLRTDPVLHCPASACSSKSHLACLAASLLENDGHTERVLPTNGPCPECHTTLAWRDLMMDLSLRQRGQDEIQKIMKEPRVNKSKGYAGGSTSTEAPEPDEDAGTVDEEGPEYDASFAEVGPGVAGSIDANDDDSTSSSSEDDLPLPVPKTVKSWKQATTTKQPIAAVADSEWDDVEEIT